MSQLTDSTMSPSSMTMGVRSTPFLMLLPLIKIFCEAILNALLEVNDIIVLFLQFVVDAASLDSLLHRIRLWQHFLCGKDKKEWRKRQRKTAIEASSNGASNV